MQRDALISAQILIWRQESYSYLCADIRIWRIPCIANLGACTIVIHTADIQQAQMATCQVTDTRGYLILGRETAQ